jgi:hypothetical protein
MSGELREVIHLMAALAAEMEAKNRTTRFELDELERAMVVAERVTMNLYAVLFTVFDAHVR